MSFEPLEIQKWIFETLQGDNTLQTLLAGSRAPNYQVGVYSEIAPEKDAISQNMPQLPYVVFTRSGSVGADETVLCGGRYYTIPAYRVTAWDNNNGSISYNRIKPVIDRVDALLSQQKVTINGITFFCQRYDTSQPFELSGDGRFDYGLTLLYRFNTLV